MSVSIQHLLWYLLGILTALVAVGGFAFWRWRKSRRRLRRSYLDVPTPLYLGRSQGHARTDLPSDDR